MGFIAVTVLAVAAVLHAWHSSSGDAIENDPVRLKLPELVKNPLDEQVPTVLSAGSPSPDLSSLEKGSVLLVFSDGSPKAGVRTATLAVEMHQRMRAYATRVVLVLPREAVAKDAAADEASIKDALKTLGVSGDIEVLLDPSDDRGTPGRFRRGRFDMKDANAAVLLDNGLELMHVTPPALTEGLVRAHIATLVVKAKSLGMKSGD
jgi:hypothetical protein